MIRSLIFFCFFILHLHARAELQAKWFGVSSVYITDGKSHLLVDPTITKPTLGHWLFNLKFKPNQKLVDRKLNQLNINQVDVIMISHQHFDHSIDAPYIAHKYNSLVIAGESQKIITHAFSPEIKTHVAAYDRDLGEEVVIGDFRITPIKRGHSAIIQSLDWHFTPGKVEKDFDYDFYDYKLGETYAYYIKHPEGNILFDQGGQYNPLNDKFLGKIDFYFTGVANKISLEVLAKNNIAKINAKRTFPLHFDFFALQSDFLEKLPLPKVNIDDIQEELKRIGYENFYVPAWGENLLLTDT